MIQVIPLAGWFDSCSVDWIFQLALQTALPCTTMPCACRLQCKQHFVDFRAGQLNLFAVISACLYRSSGRTSLFATQVFSMSSCKAISLCRTVWSVDGSSMRVEGLETCRVGSLWITPCSRCNSAFRVWVACVQPSLLYGLRDFWPAGDLEKVTSNLRMFPITPLLTGRLLTLLSHIAPHKFPWALSAGDYTFNLDAGDGFRMILGHDACPGQSCATRRSTECRSCKMYAV